MPRLARCGRSLVRGICSRAGYRTGPAASPGASTLWCREARVQLAAAEWYVLLVPLEVPLVRPARPGPEPRATRSSGFRLVAAPCLLQPPHSAAAGCTLARRVSAGPLRMLGLGRLPYFA